MTQSIAILRYLGLNKEADNLEKGLCPFCGKKVASDIELRDDFARREFAITGLCQKCQDGYFGKR